jgi:hypothetical protein
MDWLDAGSTTPKKLGAIHGNTNVIDLGFFEAPLSIVFNDMKGIVNVTAMFIASGQYLHAVVKHSEHAEHWFAYFRVLRNKLLNGTNVCSGDAT